MFCTAPAIAALGRRATEGRGSLHSYQSSLHPCPGSPAHRACAHAVPHEGEVATRLALAAYLDRRLPERSSDACYTPHTWAQGSWCGAGRGDDAATR